jgi:predicted cupin superfamily sugar epimerase
MQHLIDKHQLEPHPEGGYFREVYRSGQIVRSLTVEQNRNAMTHIYFMLTKGQVSRFHSVRHDEIWTFYDGSAIRLIIFDGFQLEEKIIGQAGHSFFSVVVGGTFQAAESTGDYSLVGCTVAPGFDFSDFSFLSQHQEYLRALIEKYPGYRKFL